MIDKSLDPQEKILKGFKNEEKELNSSIVTVPIAQNYRAKSELIKTPNLSHQNSTQLMKSKSQMQNTKDLQNKINQFQNSLLHVSNKLIYHKSQNSIASDSDFPNKHSLMNSESHNGSLNNHKRKFKKNFNGLMIDKITASQNTPNTNNNFQSVYTTEFLESKLNPLNMNKLNSLQGNQPQSNNNYNNLKKVEVLPSLHQKDVASQYLVMDQLQGGKSQYKNKFLSQSASNNKYFNSSQSNIFKNNNNNNSLEDSKQSEYFNQNDNQSLTLRNKSKNKNFQSQTEETETSFDLSRQKEKIMQGVEELKKLRRQRRDTQRKIKNLNKIKQRISKLQDLEKEIPLIEKSNGDIDQEKKKELEQKLETQTNDDNMSVISMSEIGTNQSRCSEESIFRQLDQISLTDAGDDQDRNNNNNNDLFDEVLSNTSSKSFINPCNNNACSQDNNSLPSICQGKNSKNSSVLESIIEEHQDYFDHKAGKCACGQCHCGKCQVKCLVNQKTPIFFEMKWQSSYNRFFNQKKMNYNQLSANSNIRIERQPYKSQITNSQDYTSTFKNDYKCPEDISYQKITKYQTIPPSPLYSLSTYNSNYLDWKIKVPESNKIQTQKTVVLGTPLLGSSTMKKDYPIFNSVKKTDMLKPPDQVPLPKFSLQKHNKDIKQDFIPSIDLYKSDSFYRRNDDYVSTPSYEGQYTTSNSTHNRKDINCEGTKKIYEMYQRKIEKYQKRLQEELTKLQEAK